MNLMGSTVHDNMCNEMSHDNIRYDMISGAENEQKLNTFKSLNSLFKHSRQTSIDRFNSTNPSSP